MMNLQAIHSLRTTGVVSEEIKCIFNLPTLGETGYSVRKKTMKTMISRVAFVFVTLLIGTCGAQEQESSQAMTPAPLDMGKAEEEVRKHYAAAHPEIQEYVLWTARTFGRSGMWLNEDAFASLPTEESQQLIRYLADIAERE